MPSTQSLLDLINLFERSGQPLQGRQGERLKGMPGWQITHRPLFPSAFREGWIKRVGEAGYYLAERDDERFVVDLDDDEYVYRCPTTFRKKTVPPDQVTIYAVDERKLLHWIADLLDIPSVHRHGIDQSVLEGNLWRLGRARIGTVHVDVWLVRNLACAVEALLRYFNDRTRPDHGLILHTEAALPSYIVPPRDYRFARVAEILVAGHPEPTIDKDLLSRVLTSAVGADLRPPIPVYFDSLTSTLTIQGIKEPWVVKGERQAAAVKYLFDQAQQDRWLVGAGEILAAVYKDQKIGRSQRVQNLFSGNADWERYIENPEHGKYRFKIP